MNVQKRTYSDYWGYYWRVTARHRVPGIAEWDRNLVDLILATCGISSPAEVLDLGCAGGDQAKLFAQRGHRVTGVDQVPSLIAYAISAFRNEGLTGEFLVADFRTIDYQNRFDLCVMLSGTFGLPGEGEDRRLLQRIHRGLKSGGQAFIDYLPLESYCRRPQSKTWHEIEGGYALSEEWYHAPTATWRTRNRHVFLDGRIIEAADEDGYGANEVIRCYSAVEMEGLGGAVGFSVKAHLCRRQIDHPDQHPREDEPLGMIVLRKGG